MKSNTTTGTLLLFGGLVATATLACDRKGVSVPVPGDSAWGGIAAGVGSRQVGPHTMSPPVGNSRFTQRSALVALPPSTQFDIIGFLQEASVSGTGLTAGGQLKVNGHVVTVPDQT